MEDPPLPVFNGHELGYMLTDTHYLRVPGRGVFLHIGISRGQDRGILKGSPHAFVQFVLRMHPRGRQALHDGVVRGPGSQGELVFRPVGAAHPFGIVPDELPGIVVIHVRAGLFIPAAPGAQPDHPVEFLPVSPGVVGGVDHHKAATACHIGLKCFPGGFRP